MNFEADVPMQVARRLSDLWGYDRFVLASSGFLDAVDRVLEDYPDVTAEELLHSGSPGGQGGPVDNPVAVVIYRYRRDFPESRRAA